jgi:hypothetical protein
MTDARRSEVDALRAWRRENGLPEIADPPLHWSDAEFQPLRHSRGRAVALAEYTVRMFADLTTEIVRRSKGSR